MWVHRFPGTYADARGTEPIGWVLRADGEKDHPSGFVITTTVRGITLRGKDFDALDCQGGEDAGMGLTVDRWGSVTDCTLTAAVPILVTGPAGTVPAPLHLTIQLGSARSEFPLQGELGTPAGRVRVEDRHGFVENILAQLGQRLADSLGDAAYRLRCCFTCLWSDYFPGGGPMTGMRCHRGVPQQYLAVRSKADYWEVAVTELVPDFHWCDGYDRRRLPGRDRIGYRG